VRDPTQSGQVRIGPAHGFLPSGTMLWRDDARKPQETKYPMAGRKRLRLSKLSYGLASSLYCGPDSLRQGGRCTHGVPARPGSGRSRIAISTTPRALSRGWDGKRRPRTPVTMMVENQCGHRTEADAEPQQGSASEVSREHRQGLGATTRGDAQTTAPERQRQGASAGHQVQWGMIRMGVVVRPPVS